MAAFSLETNEGTLVINPSLLIWVRFLQAEMDVSTLSFSIPSVEENFFQKTFPGMVFLTTLRMHPLPPHCSGNA